MNKLPLFLLSILLCISCAEHKVQKPEKLEVHNRIGIVMTNKKALTVDTINAGPINYYSFDAKKVPPNRKFYLHGTDDIQPNHPPLELVSDEYGNLRLASDKSIRLNRQLYAMQFLLPGEINTVWLVSEDKNTVVNTSFIPYPLEALGSDGAEISVIRLVRDGSLVRCKGTYFKNNEMLEILSVAKDKQVVVPIQCYKGAFTIDLTSPDPKSFGDTITLTIKRENGEVLTVSYPFGRESFNKDLLRGNSAKLQDEDYDKINDAVECYYKGTSPEALI